MLGKFITTAECVIAVRFNYSMYCLGTREKQDEMLLKDLA